MSAATAKAGPFRPRQESLSPASTIFEWYQGLPSRRLDLFDDYAGNEPFLIEFDSLLHHCLSDPAIDFAGEQGTRGTIPISPPLAEGSPNIPPDGFQLLHAVYKVESFLKALICRGRRCQIACFRNNELLAVPAAATHVDHAFKYRLARAVILRHLSINIGTDCGIEFHQFDSLADDDEFLRFLGASDAYFVMVHDGAAVYNEHSQELRLPNGIHRSLHGQRGVLDIQADTMTELQAQFRGMIAWFLSKEYNVALINEVQFLDSKAWHPEARFLLQQA
jgi:hypothetical protein